VTVNLFGSRLRSRLLTWLFTHPDEDFYVRELEKTLKEDSTNISRELKNLHNLGILIQNNIRHLKYVYTKCYTALLRAGMALILSRGYHPKGSSHHKTVVDVASLILGQKYKT